MVSRTAWRCLSAAWVLLTLPTDLRGQMPVDQELRQEVDALFADLDRPDSPGCVVGVTHAGETLYVECYGMADLEHATPLTTASVMDLASESKQFTAAAVLLAIEAGALSLDDGVRTWVPELPDYGHPITIRHLLHHASGLRDYGTLRLMAGRWPGDFNDADLTLELLARQRSLNFAPGDEYSYSNSGYFLLGLILERATGQTLRAFAREHLFEPLGMTSTRFADDRTEIIENRAVGHSPHDGRLGRATDNNETVGAGGLLTTIEDLARWDRLFDDRELGDGTLVETLLTRGSLNDGTPLHYARGLVVDDFDGLTHVSHGGVGGGYSAFILRFPEVRLSVSCICNTTGIDLPGRVWRAAIQFLYGPLVEQTTRLQTRSQRAAFVDPDPDVLEARTGAYRNDRTRAVWKVTPAGNGLAFDTGDGGFFVRPLDDTRFRSPGHGVAARIGFETDDRMQVTFEARPPMMFSPVELVTPDADAIAEYAGEYYSDELRCPWNLVVRDGTLHFDGSDETPFVPTVRDEFAWGAELVVSFVRDAGGEITGLVAHAERVRALPFRRRGP